MRIAQQLNRTLVLPRVRLRIPKGKNYADMSVATESFDELWDIPYFLECIKSKGDKHSKNPVRVDANPDHYDVDIPLESTFVANKFGEFHNGVGGQRLGAISDQQNNTETYTISVFV